MRVVTWNLWWRFGPWRERQKAVLAVLRELDPDVIGLQEVWAAGADNLAEWLAGELGLYCTWAPSPAPGRWRERIADPAGPGADPVDIGKAVLSRWPVVEQETLLLPAPADLADGRAALYARVAAPAFDIPVFTTHLTSRPHASAVRRAQVGALAELVARHRDGTPFPPVVTGDFNAGPDSAELRRLGGTHGTPAVPGLVLHDTWALPWTGSGPPTTPRRGTDRARGHLEFREPLCDGPAGGGAARIDHIRVGPPGPAGEGRVQGVRRAGHGRTSWRGTRRSPEQAVTSEGDRSDVPSRAVNSRAQSGS
ncbi:endonuclease/exonuclease/phosphatase family protein [Streptomyces asoensis]|uniref:endonuclease/exonuclease/phosphatase family protein n=1 Tax=Streptomyces asoensis TaxID=249586 RepID=UPI0033EBE3DD